MAQNLEHIALAKIRCPRIAGDILTRNRLYAVLDRERDKPLLWIHGPAGSGKTTLVTSWLTARNLPCLWYQVDEGDGDLSSFFYYLSRAGQAASPDNQRPLQLLTQEYLAGVTLFARRFFADLFSRLHSPSVVLFDNYQNLPAASLLHELLAVGVEQLPPGITMIIVSREGPPPAYARLRAGKKVGFVDWRTLQFQADEITGLISASRTVAPQSAEIDPHAMYELTSGWAAGLVLLLEGLRTAPVGSEKVHHVTLNPELHYQAVFDYFATELFDRLGEPLQQFLLRTAFFPSMTGAMAQRLTGTANAGRILLDLNRSHYFTDLRSGPEPVFQFHPLFREFLLTRGRDCFSPGEAAAIKGAAAGLLAEVGRIEEAAALFAEAGEADAIIRLITDHETTLLSQGRTRTLEKWLAAVPPAQLEEDANLLRIAGLCRLECDLVSARAFLEKSCANLEKRNDAAGAIIVYGCLMRALVVGCESYGDLDRYLERAHELAGRDAAAAASADLIAGTAVLALSYRSFDHPTLPFWLARAEATLANATDPPTVILQCNYLLNFYMFYGDYGRLRQIREVVLAYREVAERYPALHLYYLIFEARYAASAGADLQAGVAFAHEALRLAREIGLVSYTFWITYVLALAPIQAGDTETAATVIDVMLPAGGPTQTVLKGGILYLRAGLAYRRGLLREALEYFNASIEMHERVGCLIRVIFSNICAARVSLSLDRPQDARKYLEAAARTGWGDSRLCAFIWTLTDAAVSFHENDRDAGLEKLRVALTIGRERGIYLLHTFWDPAMLARLFAEALVAGIEKEYVTDFIRRHKIQLDDELPAAQWPYPVKISCFGRFGIEREGQPVRFSGKVQKKPLEMLKALVAFGATDVAKERITDALWPDADGDTANNSFKFTLHRLRKLLGDDDCIEVREGHLTLNQRTCYSDVGAFLGRVEILRDTHRDLTEVERESHLAQAVGIYGGDFLADDHSAHWIMTARERLKGLYLRQLQRLQEALVARGEWERAARLCEQGLVSYEQEEDLYRRLLRCLMQQKRTAEAQAVYQRCLRMLSYHNVAPSPETEELYALLRGAK